MAERKQPVEEPEPKAPLWVVTYGDLVSLLVTFFVLIYTFSSIDPDTFRRVRGSLHGAMGIMTEEHEKSREDKVQPQVNPGDETSLEGDQSRPSRQELESIEQGLEARIQDPEIFKEVIRLRDFPDGVRVSFAGDKLFAPGTTRMSRTGEELLREVARFFQGEAVDLVVEAHTDDAIHEFVAGADARELTRAQAHGAALILLDETGWIPPRIGISPWGDMNPIASNEDAAGRRQNRRIDILVLHHGD